MDARTQAQLAVIGEINALLIGLRVRYWLRGSWAIDFLVGRITRSHANIDLVLFLKNRLRVHEALEHAGATRTKAEDWCWVYRMQGQEVRIIFVTATHYGRTMTGVFPGLDYPRIARQERPFQLHGTWTMVLSPQQLLKELEAYEQATGETPREKDEESMKLLRDLLWSQSQLPSRSHAAEQP
jgi:hypothetical protein